MDLVIFEENKPFVLQALEDGDFDYIEGASEVFETEFFTYLGAKKILFQLAETYPTPRNKEEVPLWFYIASNLTMRLHGVHAFRAYPMIVRTGGMLNAFGPQAGQKVTHPDTGDITLSSKGFNNKNHYDRQSPCDQDFLRKMARDTEAEALMVWFNRDVVRQLRKRRAFDKEGIFIGDGSYLFVPDNSKYEGSTRLLFDEHNHPITKQEYEKLSDEQKARCQWRRCYKMVNLIHTNRNRDFFYFVGVCVLPGNAHECPVLYGLVDQFVEAVGQGVMKRLILDRGFLDGQAISKCKKEYGIDVLIPIKRRMDIYDDAMALFGLEEVVWESYEELVEEEKKEQKEKKEKKKRPRRRPKAVEKRERKRQERIRQLKEAKPPEPPEKTVVKRQVAAIGDFTSWSSCSVPLTVVANREHYADGHEETWFLIDTKKVDDPCLPRQDYGLRTDIEERYRQLKCFSDLTDFTSRAFSLVVNQVVFIMLAYNLLQFYLLKIGRKELNKKTPTGVRRQLLPSDSYVIVYWQNYYGLFDKYEYTEVVVNLAEEARKKIAAKCRRRRRELAESLENPRPP